MNAQQLQHEIDAEIEDARFEVTEREAADVAVQERFEADEERERRRDEDATRYRQQTVRNAQIMFAHYAASR